MKPTTEQIDRLRNLHTLAVYYREQMEAMAQECREILGCGAEESSLEADWCDEIVLQGTPVAEVIAQLTDRESKGV